VSLESSAHRAVAPAALPHLGRYVPIFRIAAGGMAEVFGAHAEGEAGFRKWVAVKRMLPHLSEDPRFVEMFLDEGRVAANVHGPNVVSTLDLGRASDGSLYLVMDLVVGVTLSTLLRTAARAGERLPVPVVVEIAAQAALGLHDAHEARTAFGERLGIVHRDVSPQNILVGVDGRARITDFGIAYAAIRETHTRTGEIKGKLSYFSPEQASLDPLDGRSDQFSLGIVAWEALAGRRLFHAENPLAILKNLTERPIPRLEEVRPGEISDGLAAVVHRALERDREARFATAQDFALALRAACGGSSAVAQPDEIGQCVRRFGEETVLTIQNGMREGASLSAAAGREAASGAAPLPAPPAAGAEHTASGLRIYVDGPRGTEEPVTVPAAPPAPPSPWPRRAALAALLGLGGLGLLFAAIGGSDGPAGGEVAPIAAPAAPASADSASVAPGPVAPASVAPASVPPPAGPEAPSLDAGLGAAPAPAPVPAAPAPAPPIPEARRPVSRGSSGRPAEPPAPEPPAALPEPTPPPPAIADEPSGPRRPRARGVDEFDRTLAP